MKDRETSGLRTKAYGNFCDLLTLETQVENFKALRTICIGHTCIEMFVFVVIIIIIFLTDYLKKGPEVSDAFEVDQAQMTV